MDLWQPLANNRHTSCWLQSWIQVCHSKVCLDEAHLTSKYLHINPKASICTRNLNLNFHIGPNGHAAKWPHRNEQVCNSPFRSHDKIRGIKLTPTTAQSGNYDRLRAVHENRFGTRAHCAIVSSKWPFWKSSEIVVFVCTLGEDPHPQSTMARAAMHGRLVILTYPNLHLRLFQLLAL